MTGFENAADAFIHVFIAIFGGMVGGFIWTVFDDDSK